MGVASYMVASPLALKQKQGERLFERAIGEEPRTDKLLLMSSRYFNRESIQTLQDGGKGVWGFFEHGASFGVVKLSQVVGQQNFLVCKKLIDGGRGRPIFYYEHYVNILVVMVCSISP